MTEDKYPHLNAEQLREAIRAFKGERCPACGTTYKSVSKTFCEECFDCLSPELQKKISDSFQFLGTFHKAMAYLKGDPADYQDDPGKVESSAGD